VSSLTSYVTIENESVSLQLYQALTGDPLRPIKEERFVGHFTASAWIVNRKRTQYAVDAHRKIGTPGCKLGGMRWE